MLEMILSHRIRLEPTVKHLQFLERCAGTARYAWNWALAEARKAYAERKESTNFNELNKRWNQEKPDWVYEVPKDCNQRPFTDLGKAYASFFKGLKQHRKVGLPRFKKKGKKDAFSVANDKTKLGPNGLWMPILKQWIKISEPLRFTGKVMSYRFTKQAGYWFVAVAVEAVHSRKRLANGIVGVDLGIKSLAVTSDGEVFEAPKPLRKSLKRLAKKQRVASRRKLGSNRRKKANAAVARLHYRISNVRKDALHKVTTKICRENQTIVLEDLNVAGMLMNRKLSRAISDVGLYEFRRQIEYKSKLYGNEVVFADRFFPSSKTCSACGHVCESLALSERVWTCMSCGVEHDRDLNAAKNLRTLGLRETSGESPKTLVDKKTAAKGKYSKASRLGEARSTTRLRGDTCRCKA